MEGFDKIKKYGGMAFMVIMAIMAIMAWPYMATDMAKLGVYLKVWENVDHLSRN